ncbi:MAG: GAF domain-containing protein [Chlamydiae bacterium]|nr:GAF domain-containing protein [Chlamydiota bacterium]
MNIYAITALIALISNTAVGLIVWRKASQANLSRYFGLTSLAISLWVLGCLGQSTFSLKYAKLFDIILYTGAPFAPTLYLHFLLIYTGQREAKKKILLLCHTLAFIFVLLNWVPQLRPWYIADVPQKFIYRSIAEPGVLWYIFSVLYTLCVSYCFYVLFQTVKKATGAKKRQTQYFLTAFTVLATGGTMYFGLVFNINFPPIDNWFTITYGWLMTYAILKHRLMDIQTVIHKTVMWLTLSSSILIPVGLIVYLIHPWLKNLSSIELSSVIGIIAVLLIPYFKLIQPRIDHLFQRRKHDLQSILQDFIHDIETLKSLDELMEKLRSVISSVLYPEKISIILFDTKSERQKISRSFGLSQDFSSERHRTFLTWIEEENEIIDHDIIEIVSQDLRIRSAIQHYLNETESKLVVPLTYDGKLLGVINLGQKRNLKPYTRPELGFLSNLKAEAAIAITNSLLYNDVERMSEELRQWATELEHKVEERTQELKKALEELQKKEAQLVQSAKMASIGELAAGVAHEINNPVSAAGAALQQLEDDYHKIELKKLTQDAFLKDLITEAIPIMKEGIARVDHIVEALTDFSRRDRPGINPNVNINTELDQVLLLLNSRMRDRIRIIKEYKSTQTIACNGGDINQVFMNIIGNAIEAIGESEGKITINTENHSHGVKIIIRDTGHGMSEETQKRIFEPFYTTKGTLGTGLGLAISYQIIKEHKGQINVRSKVGEGAEFTVHIPDQNHIETQKKKEATP